jgi:inorganic pyrophosphatase
MKFPKPYVKDSDLVHVIMETPLKSRNKFAYDEKTGLYKLKKMLPDGLAFPFGMGFIPGTKGADGDPLDALVLIREIIYPGCLVEAKLLGVIEAEQKEKGKKKVRNDRFLVMVEGHESYEHVNSIEDLGEKKIRAIGDFFEAYNKFEGRKFTVINIVKARKAHKLIKKQEV